MKDSKIGTWQHYDFAKISCPFYTSSRQADFYSGVLIENCGNCDHYIRAACLKKDALCTCNEEVSNV